MGTWSSVYVLYIVYDNSMNIWVLGTCVYVLYIVYDNCNYNGTCK